MPEHFIEVTPAAGADTKAAPVLVNLRYIDMVTQQTEDGLGDSVLHYAQGDTALPVWEPYSHLASQILQG